MPKITESEIEAFAIELLEKQGYHYLYAPSIVFRPVSRVTHVPDT